MKIALWKRNDAASKINGKNRNDPISFVEVCVIEIKVKLQPKQKRFRESIDTFPITAFGGARGGGKSYGLRNIFLIRMIENPGRSGAIFRRTYPELEANHIRPLFEQFPALRTYWHESKKLLTLPNGSTLQFSHCSNENDIALYQGREISDLGIDEAGQWTEGMFRTLLGSNRSSKAGIRPTCALTMNPGGLGHSWIKRIFIEKRLNERERPEDYNFIQALIADNPALIAADPDYFHRLNSEPNEALRKAFLYGDWEIMAGQFFGEIRREVHLVRSFTIPDHWNRFGAYDFGFNHPAAFGWFAVDEDGNVYLYRELVKPQLRIDQYAAELNKFQDTKKLQYISAGWDCWTNKSVLKTGTPPTIAEEFTHHGIYLKRAIIDRVQGAAQVRNYLAWNNLPNGRNKPRFFIFESCPLSFDALTRMQHDPDKIEDVLKVDATDGDPNSGDDCYDMVRYGLMSRPAITEALKIPIKAGSAEMIEHIRVTLDDNLEKQIQQQKDQEEQERFFQTAGMEDGELMSYYLGKRK